MRWIGSLLFAAVLVVVVVGLVLMYGRVDEWHRVRILFGEEARRAAEEAAEFPVVLPIGRSGAVIETAAGPVALEIFVPPVERPPVVLLLRGPTETRILPFDVFRGELLRHGVAVAYVRDGGIPSELRGSVTVSVLEWLAETSTLDANRIGLLAFSEAAPVALVAATQARVRVLTVRDPMMPAGFHSQLARHLPRTLILFDPDRPASVATRQSLETWLRQYAIPYDVRPLPVGPGAKGEGEAIAEAWQQMARFHLDYLRGS
jgi:hypothetical protein